MKKRFKTAMALLLSASMLFGGNVQTALAAGPSMSANSQSANASSTTSDDNLSDNHLRLTSEGSTVSEDEKYPSRSYNEKLTPEEYFGITNVSKEVTYNGLEQKPAISETKASEDGYNVFYNYKYEGKNTSSVNRAGKYEVTVSACTTSGNIVKTTSFNYVIDKYVLDITSGSAEKNVTDGTGKLSEPLKNTEYTIKDASGNTIEYLPGEDGAEKKVKKYKINCTNSVSSQGVSDNTFDVEFIDGAVSDNYAVAKTYGKLSVTSSFDENINGMGEVPKMKAVLDKKGRVKVTWGKPSSAKKTIKYSVYRMNRDNSWTLLSEKQKKKSYIDSEVRTADNTTFVYKVVAYGKDSDGVYGVSDTPGYAQCTPKLISLASGPSYKYIAIQFLDTGAKNYLVQHAYKTKGNNETITVSSAGMSISKYSGKMSKKTIPTRTYNDVGGSNITIANQKNAKFLFRVASPEFEILDYGRTRTVPKSAYSTWTTCKLTTGSTPEVKAEVDSMTAIHFTYTKVKKATGYLIEYSTSPLFSESANATTVKKFVTKKTTGEYRSWFTERKIKLTDLSAGKMYYFRVTPYFKGTAIRDVDSTSGIPGITSEVVSQCGRPGKVSDLKAEFYEDGNARADAKLTWSYDSGKYGSRFKGYVVSRQLYKYKDDKDAKSIDDVKGDKDGEEVFLVSMNAFSTKTKYVNTNGDMIPNGEIVEYRVASIYYNESDKSFGDNGYLLGETETVYYINPTDVDFKKSTYEVKTGSTTSTEIEFEPKLTTNKEVEYEIYSDDVSNPEKYVKVNEKGVLTGVKTLDSSKEVYVKVKSKSDPTKVYETARVKVTAGSGESNSGKDDDDDDDKADTSDLVVCIDPGHGGTDAGAIYGGINEKDINLTLATKVKDQLESEGVKVYMTRTSDKYVSLTDRTDYAKDKGCNLFVSIHNNSSSNTSTKGTEVYYSITSYGRKNLASHIASAVSDALGTKDRGAKTKTGDNGDYYSVIRTSAAKGIPGLIVEHAYMSNSDDLAALKDDSLLEKAAKKEAAAIIKYWKS